MSYTKQNFSSKSVLYASQLNAMDNQIATNESDISSLQSTADSNKSSISTLSSTVSSMGTRVTALEEETPPRAYLTKTYHQNLNINIDGLVEGETYTIHLVRRAIRNSQSREWSPLSELSYTTMAPSATIPGWMSHRGYMQDTYTFIASAAGNYQRTLDRSFWTNMLKPVNPPFSEATSLTVDERVRLIGVSPTRDRHAIPVSFYVTDANENVVSRCENIAYISSNDRLYCTGTKYNNLTSWTYNNFIRIQLR